MSKQYTYTCPRCGGHEFSVSAATTVVLVDQGGDVIKAAPNAGVEYDEEESANCTSCGWGGLLGETNIKFTEKEWEQTREFFGLDEAFRYSDKQQLEYVEQWRAQCPNVRITPAERDVTIAALRWWQAASTSKIAHLRDIATNDDEHPMLTDEEIDAFIENKLQEIA
jgi:predicted RNA-binding Zn-ribbon protein involved in translation (DUF1610 family)